MPCLRLLLEGAAMLVGERDVQAGKPPTYVVVLGTQGGDLGP